MDQRLPVATNNGKNQSEPAPVRGTELMYVVEMRVILASRARFGEHNDVGIRCCNILSNMDGHHFGHRQQSLLQFIRVEIKYILISSDKIHSNRFNPAGRMESTVYSQSSNITHKDPLWIENHAVYQPPSDLLQDHRTDTHSQLLPPLLHPPKITPSCRVQQV